MTQVLYYIWIPSLPEIRLETPLGNYVFSRLSSGSCTQSSIISTELVSDETLLL